MFVDLVTLEADAKVVSEKEDLAVYSARVSYRTRQAYQALDKEGKPMKSYTQFIDATFFIHKRKDEKSGETKASVDLSDLVKGAQVFVEEGDIGQDTVPSKKNSAEKSYFNRLRIGRCRLAGKLAARFESQAPVPVSASAPSRSPAPVQTREPKDPNDEISPEFLF